MSADKVLRYERPRRWLRVTSSSPSMRDNKHYLSDVAFGAAMGIAAARTVPLNAGRYGVHVAPAIAPGQIAISATLVPVGERTGRAGPALWTRLGRQ